MSEEVYPEIEIGKLKKHPRNPKMHDDEQIQEIADSITGNGMGRPLIISSDYYILAGEGAYRAVTEILKWETVPYKFLEPKATHDDPRAISYMLADNKIAEQSLWNQSILDNNFKDLKAKRFNTDLTGFKNTDLKQVESGEYSQGANAGNYGENDYKDEETGDEYKKDEFQGLVDKFEDGKPNSEKNARWFYIEYYKDESKWDELLPLLQHLISGDHEIDCDWFYNLIMQHKDEL